MNSGEVTHDKTSLLVDTLTKYIEAYQKGHVDAETLVCAYRNIKVISESKPDVSQDFELQEKFGYCDSIAVAHDMPRDMRELYEKGEFDGPVEQREQRQEEA